MEPTSPNRWSPGRWSSWRKRPSEAIEPLRMSPTWIRMMLPGATGATGVTGATGNFGEITKWRLVVKAKWRLSELQTSDRTGTVTVLEPLPRPMISMLYFHGQSTQWTPNSRRCLATTTLNSRNALLVFMNLKVAVSRTWGYAMTKTDQCRCSFGGLGLEWEMHRNPQMDEIFLLEPWSAQRSRTLKGTWKHRAGHLKVQQTSGEESSRLFIDSDQMIRRLVVQLNTSVTQHLQDKTW